MDMAHIIHRTHITAPSVAPGGRDADGSRVTIGIIGRTDTIIELIPIGEAAPASDKPKMFRVWLPPGSSHYYLITGKRVMRPSDGTIAVTEEEMIPLLQLGGKRVD
jgi:hypothetical protein